MHFLLLFNDLISAVMVGKSLNSNEVVLIIVFDEFMFRNRRITRKT